MTWKPKKDEIARPADTYRGARRNKWRGLRRSLVLRSMRRDAGMTRRQFDKHLARHKRTA